MNARRESTGTRRRSNDISIRVMLTSVTMVVGSNPGMHSLK